MQGDKAGNLLAPAQSYLLWAGYRGFFAVVFWYALLGPLAALGYRLLVLLRDNAQQPVNRSTDGWLLEVMDWLPVCFLLLGFAFIGRFVEGLNVLLENLLNTRTSAQELLLLGACSADDLKGEAMGEEGVQTLDSLWQLMIRAAALWFVVVALTVFLR